MTSKIKNIWPAHSIEEANKIISEKIGGSQTGNSTVSEVMTV